LCEQRYKPEENEEKLIFPHIDEFKNEEQRKAILAGYGSERISHELERRSLDTEGENCVIMYTIIMWCSIGSLKVRTAFLMMALEGEARTAQMRQEGVGLSPEVMKTDYAGRKQMLLTVYQTI